MVMAAMATAKSLFYAVVSAVRCGRKRHVTIY